MPSGLARWVLRALLVLGPAVFIAGYVVPWAAGAQVRVVSGRSMEPAMSDGDTFIAFAVDPADLAVGDIVRFPRLDGGRGSYVHRVVAIEEGPPRLMRTAGDGNRTLDEWVLPAATVYGRVDEAYLPYSAEIGFLRSPWGLLLLGVLPVALFVTTLRPSRPRTPPRHAIEQLRYVPPEGRAGTPGG